METGDIKDGNRRYQAWKQSILRMKIGDIKDEIDNINGGNRRY